MRAGCFLLISLLFLGCCAAAQCPADDAIKNELKNPNPAEKVLLEQFKAAAGADLLLNASTDKERYPKLPGIFVRYLLCQSAKRTPAFTSVTLSNAEVMASVLNTPLQKDSALIAAFSIQGEKFPFTLILKSCFFDDFVSFEDVVFDHSLTIVGSDFPNGIRFSDVIIKKNFEFYNDLKDEPSDSDARAKLFEDLRQRGMAERKGQGLYINATVEGTANLFLSGGSELHPAPAPSVIELRVKTDSLTIEANTDVSSLTLSGTEAKTVRIDKFKGRAPEIHTFDASGAQIKDLHIKDAEFDTFKATESTRIGQLTMSRVDIVKELDLSYATTDYLKWSRGDRSRPLPPTIKMTGISFQDLQIASSSDLEPPDKEDPARPFPPLTADLLSSSMTLLKQAEYSGAAFDSVEQNLRKRGLTSDADNVWELNHERQRVQQRDNYLWVASDLAREYILGYGRIAHWPIMWSVVVVVIGAFLFRKIKMKELSADPISYSPLWYSIELFLPVVTLGMAKDWRPNRDWLATYARFHQLAGWVLIPVALAALTGITK